MRSVFPTPKVRVPSMHKSYIGKRILIDLKTLDQLQIRFKQLFRICLVLTSEHQAYACLHVVAIDKDDR